MGARWSWTAICENGHIYSNFSGGADPCYECDAQPVCEVDDDTLSVAEVNAALWTALAEYQRRDRERLCQLCGQPLPVEEGVS